MVKRLGSKPTICSLKSAQTHKQYHRCVSGGSEAVKIVSGGDVVGEKKKKKKKKS